MQVSRTLQLFRVPSLQRWAATLVRYRFDEGEPVEVLEGISRPWEVRRISDAAGANRQVGRRRILRRNEYVRREPGFQRTGFGRANAILFGHANAGADDGILVAHDAAEVRTGRPPFVRDRAHLPCCFAVFEMAIVGENQHLATRAFLRKDVFEIIGHDRVADAEHFGVAGFALACERSVGGEELSADAGIMQRFTAAGMRDADVGDEIVDFDAQFPRARREADALRRIGNDRHVFPIGIVAEERFDAFPAVGAFHKFENESRTCKTTFAKRHIEAVEVKLLDVVGIVPAHPLDEFPVRLKQTHAVADPFAEIRRIAAAGDVVVDVPSLRECAFDGDRPVAVFIDEPLEESVPQHENFFAAVQRFAEGEQFHVRHRSHHRVDTDFVEWNGLALNPVIQG